MSISMRACLQNAGEDSARTVLPDRRCAPKDEDGLARVLGLAAIFVWRSEVSRFRVGVVIPEPGGDGGESKRDRRGLVKRDVLGDLFHQARQSDEALIWTYSRSQFGAVERTLAVISAGTMA